LVVNVNELMWHCCVRGISEVLQGLETCITYPNPGDLKASTQFKLPTYQPAQPCHILLSDYAAVAEVINRRPILRYCAGRA